MDNVHKELNINSCKNVKKQQHQYIYHTHTILNMYLLLSHGGTFRERYI